MPENSQTDLARKLRKHSTKAEQIMWGVLRNRQLGGYKFYRQEPVGSYIVDFCCRSKRLIIEIDGGVHVGREGQDEEREKAFVELNYRIIRFTNDQVIDNLNQVVEAILASLR